LLAFAAFATIAFSSYLFTWFADFDKVAKAYSEATSLKSIEIANAAGYLGFLVAHFFIYNAFGIFSFGFIPIIVIFALKLFSKAKSIKILPFLCQIFFFMLWGASAFALIFTDKNIFSGVIGFEVATYLDALIGTPGAVIVLILALLIFVAIAYNFFLNINFLNKNNKEKQKSNLPVVDFQDEDTFASRKDNMIDDDDFKEEKDVQDDGLDLIINNNEENNQPIIIDNVGDEEPVEQNTHGIDTPYDPYEDLPNYKFPTIDLLEDYKNDNKTESTDDLVKNKRLIEKTLKDFGVEIANISATVGPTVTLYEIVPAAGVRISKIQSLENDIALNLQALGIRIIAPIPGKGTIGIEVPNTVKKIVPMRSILASQDFKDTNFDLPLALGKTIQNKNFIIDLAKMPHILMAGATGQGKSVGINAIVASLLYKKHPADLKFVFVDPKKVEMSLYAKIEKHYLAAIPDNDSPIITDTQKVIKTLNSLCAEMDKRYDLLKAATCKNLKEYNAKFIARRLNPLNGHRYLPYIVLVIDEFADLIITAGREIESPIMRLAQLARAVGIHLIIATQRPSVKIITGGIKANFPARIAFRVSQRVDSNTIIDSKGAEQLIGRGDMLFAAGIDVIRLQCALLDTPEIERIVNFIGDQNGYTNFYELPEVFDENLNSGMKLDEDDRDPLFVESAEIVVGAQQASTSLLQRKLTIGFARAGRITDQLEQCGIISQMVKGKRDVLISDLAALNAHLEKLR
jgi:S-DNA-T family DNA segregation ATPase FtsK/SpoIIIE